MLNYIFEGRDKTADSKKHIDLQNIYRIYRPKEVYQPLTSSSVNILLSGQYILVSTSYKGYICIIDISFYISIIVVKIIGNNKQNNPPPHKKNHKMLTLLDRTLKKCMIHQINTFAFLCFVTLGYCVITMYLLLFIKDSLLLKNYQTT